MVLLSCWNRGAVVRVESKHQCKWLEERWDPLLDVGRMIMKLW